MIILKIKKMKKTITQIKLNQRSNTVDKKPKLQKTDLNNSSENKRKSNKNH